MKNINLYYGYIPKVSVDANLHPKEQKKVFLELIRSSAEDVIYIYCNSPYIINYLTILEAYSNKEIPEKYRREFKNIWVKNKHFEIKEDGSVVEGKYYKSMISDENILNEELQLSNDEFSDLLDLENALEAKCEESDIRIQKILKYERV